MPGPAAPAAATGPEIISATQEDPREAHQDGTRSRWPRPVALTACGNGDGSDDAATARQARHQDPALAGRHRHAAGGSGLAEGTRSRSRTPARADDRAAGLGRSRREADHRRCPATRDPDVVEVGNTQAATFTSAGAFTDMSDEARRLGGDDLLPGFVDGATLDGKIYAVPYYAGLEARLLPQGPVQEGRHRGADDAERLRRRRGRAEGGQARSPPNFSGIYFPGQDWRNALRTSGTPAATWPSKKAASGRARCPTPESMAGLKHVQQLIERGLGRGQGRQRDRPADAVLRRPDRHAVRRRAGSRA